MSQDRSIRGKVAVAGVGETTYYKHGQSPDPEFKMALEAILNACADAGINPREVDGFCSYSTDRNEPSRLAAALGLPDLKYACMQWGGGGGGGSAAIGTAMAAIAAGYADCIVVFRALAQGQFQRFGAAVPSKTTSGDNAFTAPYGVMSPAQRYAMKAMRFMHEQDRALNPTGDFDGLVPSHPKKSACVYARSTTDGRKIRCLPLDCRTVSLI